MRCKACDVIFNPPFMRPEEEVCPDCRPSLDEEDLGLIDPDTCVSPEARIRLQKYLSRWPEEVVKNIPPDSDQ